MKKNLLNGMVAAIASFVTMMANAQVKKALNSNCEDCRPLPQMLVRLDEGDTRRSEFQKDGPSGLSKYTRLVQLNGAQDVSINYTADAMKDLVAYFDAEGGTYPYVFAVFARYDMKTAPTNFPMLHNNEMIFLFTISRNNYYFVHGADVVPVPNSTAVAWISQFKTGLMPTLASTVDPTDPSNFENNVLSDTREICYKRADFNEAFILEPQYQLCKFGITISDFEVAYSAYTAAGRDNSEQDATHYRNRLFLQFSYLTTVAGESTPVNIKDELNYQCRLNNTHPFDSKSYIDNGQLCPTICN